MSRLKSVRKRRDQEKECREDDGIDNPAASSTQDEPFPTAQDSSQPTNVKAEADADAPKPVRGLRKATVSTKQPVIQADRPQSIDQAGPLDYLYFGEGVSQADVSQSLQTRGRSKSTDDAPHQPPTGSCSTATTSGKDQSGFLKTELNTHTTQMGYNNLTYGGSLQYDYAGTQG